MEKEILAKLIDQNLSTREIARFLKISQSTVKHYLKKYGLKTLKAMYNVSKSLDFKFCSLCKETKSIDSFYKKGDRAGYYSYCAKCFNQYTIDAQRSRKKFIVDYYGGCCNLCGYCKCLSALEFHHIDPDEKDPSYGSFKNRSFERIKPELDKCLLVCSNCHREIHAGLIIL